MAWLVARGYFESSSRVAPELTLDTGYIVDVGGVVILPSTEATRLGCPESHYNILDSEREGLYQQYLSEAKRLMSGGKQEDIEWHAKHRTDCCQAWGSRKISFSIEVKCSRSDFLNHFGKTFEQKGRNNLYANFQYVFAPMNVISPSELPLDWGLIEVMKRGCRIAKPSRFNDQPKMTLQEWDSTLLWKKAHNWTWWDRFMSEQSHLAKKMIEDYREAVL